MPKFSALFVASSLLALLGAACSAPDDSEPEETVEHISVVQDALWIPPNQVSCPEKAAICNEVCNDADREWRGLCGKQNGGCVCVLEHPAADTSVPMSQLCLYTIFYKPDGTISGVYFEGCTPIL